METFAITELTVEDIRRVVREATAQAFDPSRIADFVALVDWTGIESAPSAVRETLGLIEEWATAFSEGDLGASDYRAALTGLLPAPAR